MIILVVIWLVLLLIAIIDLKNKKLKFRWQRWILFFIGITGIILDGYLLIALYANLNLLKYAWIFDHFGIPVFLFIIWLSISDFKNKNITRKNWTKWLLFIIGILGLIADSFILLRYWIGV